MSTQEIIKYLDDQSTKTFFIEYRRYLSNHLSHGIIALCRLGADKPRLDKFTNWYNSKLENPAYDKPDQRPFGDLKGERVAFYRILEHYEELLNDKYKSLYALIRGEYPKVSLGLSGSALHGTIHLGYGLAAESERVVLEGLAYTYYSYTPLIRKNVTEAELKGFGSGSKGILDIFAEVRANDALYEAMKSGRFLDEYAGRKVGDFQTCVTFLLSECGDDLLRYVLSLKLDKNLRSPDGTVDPIKLSRRIVYWATIVLATAEKKNDFFLLHGVTCAWSLYQVVPHLDVPDGTSALRTFVTVLLAVYLAQDKPSLNVTISKSLGLSKTDWERVVDEAISEDRDEHCYKLVQVCKEMAVDAETYGEDAQVYMQAAQNSISPYPEPPRTEDDVVL